jgi:hypothetical protein
MTNRGVPLDELGDISADELITLEPASEGKVENTERLMRVLQRLGEKQLSPAVTELRQDALVELAQQERPFVVPRGGVRFDCEACGAPAEMRRARQPAKRVAWFSFTDCRWDTLLDWLPPLLEAHSLPERRHHGDTVLDDRDRYWMDRWVVVCGQCLHRNVRRCSHEDREVKEKDWTRCTSIISGHPIFCDKHRADRWDYLRRQTDMARRAPDSQRSRTYS